MGVTLMNDTDAVIEFEKGVKITEIAQLLHSIDSWVEAYKDYKVEVGCIIATKKQLVKTTMDIEDHRRAARDLERKRKEFEENNKLQEYRLRICLISLKNR